MKMGHQVGSILESILAFILIVIIIFIPAITAQDHTVDAWLQKGDEFYKNRSYDLALRCYDKAIEIDPMSAKAWENKGNVLKQLNHTDKADEAFSKASDLITSKVSDDSLSSGSLISQEDSSPYPSDHSNSRLENGIVGEGKFVLLKLMDDLTLHELGYSEADPGKKFILVNVNAKNHGYHEFDLDPYCIKMTVNKIVYDRVYLSLADHGYPPLEEVTIQDGGETSGYVAFSVPDGSYDYSLKYDQWSWDNYNIIWND